MEAKPKSKPKCLQCGTPMETTRETMPYDATGLPGVMLGNVPVNRCPECHEYEVGIPAMDELLQVLALALINAPGRLAGHEIRFLRKCIGLSGKDFAGRLGVSAETVSRWENDREPMGGQADRVLRLMVAHGHSVEEYPLEKLDEVSAQAERPRGFLVQPDDGSWRAQAQV